LTYIGQQPSTTFDSGIQDRFTGLTTNTVTLTHDISAETDILVVWNNIVQDSSTYSVGGTGNKTLTLGGTLSSGDVVTVYYTNRVMQSVSPTAGSVTTTTINDGAVTNDKLAGSIANSKLANSSITLNGSAVSLGGSATVGGTNTPAFEAWSTSDQAVNDNTTTKVQCGTEVYDTASAYDNSSNYRFTPQTAGKYFCYGQVFIETSVVSSINQATAYIYKNGSVLGANQNKFYNNPIQQFNVTVSTVINFNGSSDYIELYAYFDGDEDRSGIITGQTTYRRTMFGAYKIII